MAIEFTYARRLEEIIQPAVDYLSHATGDLFVKQRIIVPTAGMKAWLLAELATRLGATASHDGIVANVLEFSSRALWMDDPTSHVDQFDPTPRIGF